jgi:hypothetical protein
MALRQLHETSASMAVTLSPEVHIVRVSYAFPVLTSLIFSLAACGSSEKDGDGGDATGGSGGDGASTGGATTGGGSGGGSNGGSSNGGESGAGSGNEVAIQFGNCDPFSACGGDETGTWQYTEACLDPSGFEDALRQYCSGATVSFEGVISGTIAFVGGMVIRDGSYSITATLEIPEACKLGTCAGTAVAVAQLAPGATCVDASTGGCTCTATRSGGNFSGQTYTAADNTITLQNGRTFDYCVNNGTLTYQETTDDGEPGIFTIQEQ